MLEPKIKKGDRVFKTINGRVHIGKVVEVKGADLVIKFDKTGDIQVVGSKGWQKEVKYTRRKKPVRDFNDKDL